MNKKRKEFAIMQRTYSVHSSGLVTLGLYVSIKENLLPAVLDYIRRNIKDEDVGNSLHQNRGKIHFSLFDSLMIDEVTEEEVEKRFAKLKERASDVIIDIGFLRASIEEKIAILEKMTQKNKEGEDEQQK